MSCNIPRKNFTFLPISGEEFEYFQDLCVQTLFGLIPLHGSAKSAYRNYCKNLYSSRLKHFIEELKIKGVKNVKVEFEEIFKKAPDESVAKTTIMRNILNVQDASNDRYLVNILINWQKGKINSWLIVVELVSLLSELDVSSIQFVINHVEDTTIEVGNELTNDTINSKYLVHKLYRLGLLDRRLDGKYDFNDIAKDLDRYALSETERVYKKAKPVSIDLGEFD